MRTRIKADWFSVTPPDENHDYWFLTFLDNTKKNDVHIEISDVRKLRDELNSHIFSRKEDET